MAKFTIVLQDATGAVQTGLNVDLYTGSGGGAKYGDFSENTDGSYSINVTTSGLYTVKVGGITETELQNIYIPTEDIDSRITANANDIVDLQEGLSLHVIGSDHDTRYYTKTNIDGKLALLPGAGLVYNAGALDLNLDTSIFQIQSDQLNLIDGGVRAEHLDSGVVSKGLKQIVSGALETDPDEITIGYTAGNKLQIISGAIRYYHLLTSFLHSLSRLNLLYGYSTTISSTLSVDMRTVDSCTEGYTANRNGFVSAISVRCLNNLGASDTVTISIIFNISVATSILLTSATGNSAKVIFTDESYSYLADDRIRCHINSSIADGDISNISVVLEITNSHSS